MDNDSNSFSEIIKIYEMTPEEFLAISMKVLEIKKWRISSVDQDSIIAFADINNNTWDEQIEVRITDSESAEVRSLLAKNSYNQGKNHQNVESFIDTFNEISLGITDNELKEYLDKLQKFKAGSNVERPSTERPPSDKLKEFMAILNPVKGYLITPIIIDLNILVFALMVFFGMNIFSPDVRTLFSWGGLFTPDVVKGEYYRMFTSIFIHAGIIHLGMNMFALIMIGPVLENLIGSKRLAAAYVLCGLASSLASMTFSDYVVSVGASGAIFGLYGVFGALATTKLIDKSIRMGILRNLGIFVIFNVAYGFSNSGIDNFAHLGGLLSGLIIGYALYPSITKPESSIFNKLTVPVLTIFLLMLIFLQIDFLKDESNNMNNILKKMRSNEDKALLIIRNASDRNKDAFLLAIKDTGINCWNQNLNLIDSINKYKKARNLKSYMVILKSYTELRAKQYDAIYKKVSSGSTEYDSLINYYLMSIDSIVHIINRNYK